MFTSRLPVSTSARRPTGHTDASKSFVGSSNRQSNIPVTVRKANLFTPQTKGRTSQFGGASTTGKSYLSGLTTDKKFQRTSKPAPDRDEQLKMFDNLADYLKAYAPFQAPEAKKFFSSVSTTESTRIFEFLISRVLPDFKITRLDSDVPEALGLLDYPFIRTVTRSSLVSVTTRQAAVGLLCIFNWLLSKIRLQDEQTNAEDGHADEEKARIHDIIFTHPDCADEANQALFQKLYSPDDSESLYLEMKELDLELERITEGIRVRDEFQRELQEVDSDLNKCRIYGQELEEYKRKMASMQSDLEQEARVLTEPDRDEEERMLKSEIDNHEFNVAKIRTLKERFTVLETKLNSLRDDCQMENQRESKLESECLKSLEELRKGKQERISLYKEFENIYTQVDIDSSLLHELINNLRDCIVSLEQSSINDVSDAHKINHEHSIDQTKTVMMRSRIETELNNSLTELRQLVHKLEADFNHLSTSELPRLREKEKRVDRDLEGEKSVFISSETKLKAEIAADELRTSHQKESLDKRLQTKIAVRDQLYGQLNDKQRLMSDLDQSDEQRTSLFVKTEMMELHRLKRDSEQLAKSSKDDLEIARHNLETVREMYRMFKKRGII